MLVGRVDESGALDRVLAGARNEVGGALVLRGPAGIGKTALLDWAVGRAADMDVTRVAGLESEVDLGFAGLHQVLVPFLARVLQTQWQPASRPRRLAAIQADHREGGPRH